MSTLTVCTITDRDPVAVAVAMRPWRDVADEILVVLDHRVDTSRIDALAGIADRVLRIEFAGDVELHLDWLRSMAAGDWFLRVDGDEVPSRALLDRLGRGDWHRDVTHVYLARRWLWGDAGSMLAGHPWTPDFQLRLLPTMPGLLRFRTQIHELPHVDGPGRFLLEPIYHAELLVRPEEDRRRKVREYERRNRGIRTDDAWPQNLSFYVPEARPTAPPTVPVPEADRALLRELTSVLHLSRHAPEPDPTGVVRLGDVRERMPEPDEITVEIVDGGPSVWPGGGTVTVTVAVGNLGEDVWDPLEDPPLQVGARLLDGAGVPIGEFRAGLPAAVRPGATEIVRVPIGPLPAEGPHVLRIGLLREDVAWVDRLEDLDVEIVRRGRIVIGAGISPHRHLGDDLILRTVIDSVRRSRPDSQIVLLADDPPEVAERFGEIAVYGAAPIIHRVGVVDDPGIAMEVVDALVEDARRFAAGEPVSDAHHEPLVHLLADSDLLILLGAGWVTDPFWRSQLLPHAAEAQVASVLGVPVVLESATVGPLTEQTAPMFRRLATASDRVSVRDRTLSRRTAERFALDDSAWIDVADVATAAEGAPETRRDAWLRHHGIDSPHAVVGIRSREQLAAEHDAQGAGAVDGALGELVRRGLHLVFLPHVEGSAGADDLDAARDLATRFPLIVPDSMPDDDLVVALIRGATVTVGNRFHLGVLADSAGVPGVFLATSEFDEGRASAHDGGNIVTVRDGDHEAGVRAVSTSLERGRGRPGSRWDDEPLARSVAEAVDRRRQRS